MNPIYEFLITTGQNLFNYWAGDATIGAVLSLGGNTVESSAFNTSGYMKVTPGSRVQFGLCYNYVFYDANKVRVPGGAMYDPDNTTIKVPDDAYYIRSSTQVADWRNFTVYELKLMHPVYKDDLAKDWEIETNNHFYRPKISGKISFVGKEFDLLNNATFETEFQFYIYKSNDWGQTWSEYYHGKFMKTDCQWSIPDKKVTLQPNTVDEYNDVLAGLEKEYNLITLAPKINRLNLTKRPLIQCYIPGDSVVSCFLSGNYWEQDANAVTDRRALVYDYHFALCNMLKEIRITADNGTPKAVAGLYAGSMKLDRESNNFTGSLYPDTSNGFRIDVAVAYIPPFFGIVNCNLVRTSDNTIMFSYSTNIGGSGVWDNLDFTMNANIANGATGTVLAEMATYNIYVRYLLDVDTISGLNTYPIPADDIVENNRNYKRAIGYAIDVGYISNNFSNEPTQWGLADNGKYFIPPYSIWGQTFFPIARSTWRYASIWFGFATFDWILEREGRKTYTLRDAYPLASVISVLLGQIAPGITHEATPEYSQFLYGTGSNPIGYNRFTLLITQKTNILKGEYDQPAQKAPVTLQQITNMLRDCFRCYWYIQDGKFKIEHIQWFRNGGSYSYNQQFNVDLQEIINTRNGKSWDFNTAAWEFDKVDMPERFQFEWMDDVTQAFEGYPIEVLSKYVTPGKIETINVSNFTTDVDFMLLNPGEMSNDGFALFAAISADNSYTAITEFNTFYWQGVKYPNRPPYQTYRVTLPKEHGNIYVTGATSGVTTVLATYWSTNEDGSLKAYIGQSDEFIGTGTVKTYTRQQLNVPANCGQIFITYLTGYAYGVEIDPIYRLPFVQYSNDGLDYEIQNGYLSWIYLQPTYYPYDLPARRVKINNSETYAYGIDRKKKQTVTYPSIDDPDPMKLIKTSIGSGQIDKISITLHSRSNKVTLKYDTE